MTTSRMDHSNHDHDATPAARAICRKAYNASSTGVTRSARSGERAALTATSTVKLPAKSLAYFTDLANDAGNWSGTPWLDGNVSGGLGASAMSQTLVRHGLINVHDGGDGAYCTFTSAGVTFAATLGIDIAWTQDNR